MKKNIFTKKNLMIASLSLVLICGPFYSYAITIPQKVTLKSNITVYSNQNSSIDASNLDQGIIDIKHSSNNRIKVQITKTGGSTYTYDLNGKGNSERFPLTDGNGNYSVKIFENTNGTKYAQVFSQNLDVKITNSLSPFLYANQYVNFKSGSNVTKKASELIQGKTTDLAKLTAIYTYIIDNFTYDTVLASTVQSGYLPDVDKVLASKKGICFDYSAVMASMLRSQNIPCKLVVGYAGTIYHAWISVYLSEVGWVEKAVYFDGKDWKLMDPTFASSGKNSASVAQYIGNGSNYSQKYVY